MLFRRRGCGVRQVGGLYLTSPLVPEGMGFPIGENLIDPPVPWVGGPFRTPYLVEQEGSDGQVFDVFIWVGEEFYPTVPDFIEEVREMGISRRVPVTFNLASLTPEKSRMLFVHKRAKPRMAYELDPASDAPRKCSKGHGLSGDPDNHCVFALWDLGALAPQYEDKHTMTAGAGGRIRVKTPSADYEIVSPMSPCDDGDHYAPGVFSAFYFSHAEYIGEEVPDAIRVPAGQNGVPVIPMEG